MVAVEFPAAGVGPAAQFHQRHLVVEPQRLFGGQPGFAGDDRLQKAGVGRIQVGMDGWRCGCHGERMIARRGKLFRLGGRDPVWHAR